MLTASEYVLAGGATEVERLRIQALTWELEVETMLNEMALERSSTCIDVGCGSMGIIGSLARRVGPFGRVYALDFDPVLLQAAREYVDREGFGNVVFLQGDLFHNNLPPKSVRPRARALHAGADRAGTGDSGTAHGSRTAWRYRRTPGAGCKHLVLRPIVR